jgi:hypothetical protein
MLHDAAPVKTWCSRVVINTGVRPAAQRSSVAIYLIGDRAVADGRWASGGRP